MDPFDMRTSAAFFIEITGIGSKVKRADESQKILSFQNKNLMIDCTKSIATTNLSPQSENINLRLGVCLLFEVVLTPSVLNTLSLSRKKMTS